MKVVCKIALCIFALLCSIQHVKSRALTRSNFGNSLLSQTNVYQYVIEKLYGSTKEIFLTISKVLHQI